MAERPILFADEMVRALLSGKETQTRRCLGREARHVGFIGGQGERDDPARWGYWCEDSWGRWAVLARGLDEHHAHGSVSIPCPFGVVGDRLWVRECWAALDADWRPVSHPHDIKDGPWPNVAYRVDHIDQLGDGPAHPMKWRPSIHMPRWASRLTLEITEVRVERLLVRANPWVWVLTFKRVEVKP
jgi:hypothetical protein